MKAKRLICIVVVLIFALSFVLAGCGETDAMQKQIDAMQAQIETLIGQLNAANGKTGLLEEQLKALEKDDLAGRMELYQALIKNSNGIAELSKTVNEHKAANSNALSDLVILHTNDTHGRAVKTGAAAGFESVAATKKLLEDMGKKVLLLDAGDAAQGAPIVNLSQGAEAVNILDQAGYDYATVGNHEFDWGSDNLIEITKNSKVKYLAANIFYTDTTDLVFKANDVIAYNGVKIGIFGLATPETATKAHPDKVKGVEFKADQELYDIAQAQIDELKTAGCKYIIALGHLGIDESSAGNRSTDVIANTNGIDLFVDGHSHSVIENREVDNKDTSKKSILASTGSYTANVGMILIEGSTTYKAHTQLIAASFYTAKLPDISKYITPSIVKYVNELDKAVDKELSAVIGKTEVLLVGVNPTVRTKETNLGDFAADAILSAAKTNYSENVVAAVTNGGGIRDSIAIGDISMKTMKTVFPFGNEVTVIEVTGAQLLEALEAATFSTPTSIGAFPQVSGIEFTIDTTKAFVTEENYPGTTYGKPKTIQRVSIQKIGGQAFDIATDADKKYLIATNDFTAAGGDTYYIFKSATLFYKTGVALEDSLIALMKSLPDSTIKADSIYAAPQGRITIIKAAA